MAQQNDIQAGFDLSSVNPVSQSQMMQAVENLAPLANIGFIVIQATAPSIVDNPRFARYIWLDSSVTPYEPHVHDGANWVALPLGANAVIAAYIANGAVTYNTKIGGFAPAAADALKYMRVDAAGTAVELITLNSAALPTIDLSKLSTTGAAANYFLKRDAGNTTLVYEPFDTTFIPAGAIAHSKLVAGIAAQYGFLLRANNAVGTIELISNDDEVSDFLAPGSAVAGIHPSKLSGVGAVSGDTLRYNGANWVHSRPHFALIQNLGTGALSAAALHNLGGYPRVLQAWAVCNTADNGYLPTQRMDINGIYTAGGTPAVAVWADISSVYISKFAAAGLESRPAAGGAAAAIVEGSWDIWVYASL